MYLPHLLDQTAIWRRTPCYNLCVILISIKLNELVMRISVLKATLLTSFNQSYLDLWLKMASTRKMLSKMARQTNKWLNVLFIDEDPRTWWSFSIERRNKGNTWKSLLGEWGYNVRKLSVFLLLIDQHSCTNIEKQLPKRPKMPIITWKSWSWDFCSLL